MNYHTIIKIQKHLYYQSLTDQWGLVINEAITSGVPCIVSKNCGCYFDLIKNAKTGWGFDSENIKELSNLMKKLRILIMQN